MRRSFLLCLAIGLGLSGLAASAFAATKTPVTFTDTIVSTGAPTRVWVSDGVLHIRGQPQTTAVTGDISGTFSLDANLNLDLATGNGELFGAFDLTTATVTWKGSFAAKVAPDGVSGTFVGHGNDGTQLKGRFTSIGPTSFLNQAVILDPHG